MVSEIILSYVITVQCYQDKISDLYGLYQARHDGAVQHCVKSNTTKSSIIDVCIIATYALQKQLNGKALLKSFPKK